MVTNKDPKQSSALDPLKYYEAVFHMIPKDYAFIVLDVIHDNFPQV